MGRNSLLFSLFLAALVSLALGECPVGWIVGPGQECYKVSEEDGLTWYQAQQVQTKTLQKHDLAQNKNFFDIF